MMPDEPLFCIFPYVEIAEEIHIREERLFPSTRINDFKFLEPYKDIIMRLEKFFYWYSNQNITNLTWAFLPPNTDNRRYHEFTRHLEEIRKILGYLCCVPDDRPQHFHLNHHYEQVDYFLFQPTIRIWHGFLHCIKFDIPTEQDEKYQEYFEGFEYSVNQGGIWSIADGCRIYPQSRNVSRPFELHELLDRVERHRSNLSILSLFYEDRMDDEQEERIFNSLEWYNRSCKADTTSDLSLVSLAVAFETLLGTRQDDNSERGGISQKILTSIQFLVGNPLRLDSWFQQFYKARSRILHEGEWSQLRFSVTEEGSKSLPPH